MKNVNRLWAWGSRLKKSQGLFSQASWPDSPSLVINVSFHFRLHGGPFHRGDLFSASGKQKGVSECPSCVGCFLTNFNSQITNMPLYTFEGKLLRSPDSHESRVHRNEMSVLRRNPREPPYSMNKGRGLIRHQICLSLDQLVLASLQKSEVEKAMAPHSSTLAWKIPWMEEPGGLQSMGSLRVGHN